MKTIHHGANARDSLLHIETDGAVVNIRVGLSDVDGRRVTSVEIIPDDSSRGGDGAGRVWTLDGARNNRIIRDDAPCIAGCGEPAADGMSTCSDCRQS